MTDRVLRGGMIRIGCICFVVFSCASGSSQDALGDKDTKIQELQIQNRLLEEKNLLLSKQNCDQSCPQKPNSDAVKPMIPKVVIPSGKKRFTPKAGPDPR